MRLVRLDDDISYRNERVNRIRNAILTTYRTYRPEIDKIEWFTVHEAEKKINPGQIPLLLELASLVE